MKLVMVDHARIGKWAQGYSIITNSDTAMVSVNLCIGYVIVEQRSIECYQSLNSRMNREPVYFHLRFSANVQVGDTIFYRLIPHLF